MRILLLFLVIYTLVLTSCLGCIERERQALLNFKSGFPANNNSDNSLLSSWTAKDRDCCSWEGVECDQKTSQIVSLALSGAGLQGPLPHNLSFHSLVSLHSLDLSFNELQGPVPTSLGALCNLKKLDLSWNSFSQSVQDDIFYGISSGCTRVSLEVLVLSYNHFNGSLPKISTLPLLRSLYLDNNQLQGFSPDSFWPDSGLLVLDLRNNELTGALPDSIGKMSRLKALMVSSNNLVGVISPAHFLNLSNLQVLDLSDNNFSFNLRSDFVFPSQLVSMNLRSCKLGPKFPSWLKGQTNFSHLDISNSGISDAIPTWFWDLSSNLRYLNLSFNGFNEEVQNRKYRFRYPPAVDLSSNSFYGPIPQFLSNTTVLKLSTNKFSGNLSFLCNIKNSAMTYLDLSDNLLAGQLPDCWKSFRGLEIVKLDNNNFSGRIPSSVGWLDQTPSLSLRNNSLSGELPMSLGNCVALKVLDLGENKLSGSIPSWFGKLQYLTVLSLKSNEFQGDIPDRLCNSWMQIIDLSMNNLSGAIPSCLTNLSSMADPKVASPSHISLLFYYTYFDILVGDNGAYEDEVGSGYFDDTSVTWKGWEHEYGKTILLLKAIDFSSNRLSGEIPGDITGLLGLNALNLSRNMLNGSIPSEIGQLQLLESLDLSENKISGQIPSSMVELSYLSVLDLSDNNLSGKIPTSTQLQSFGPVAYRGNLELCGAPLETCPWEKPAESPSVRSNIGGESSEDDEGWSESQWFYFGMGVGFTVGLIGVLALLLTNRPLRQRYFQVLSSINHWIFVTIALKHARLKRFLRS